MAYHLAPLNRQLCSQKDADWRPCSCLTARARGTCAEGACRSTRFTNGWQCSESESPGLLRGYHDSSRRNNFFRWWGWQPEPPLIDEPVFIHPRIIYEEHFIVVWSQCHPDLSNRCSTLKGGILFLEDGEKPDLWIQICLQHGVNSRPDIQITAILAVNNAATYPCFVHETMVGKGNRPKNGFVSASETIFQFADLLPQAPLK